jgi:methionyl-tRNA formyltransferase
MNYRYLYHIFVIIRGVLNVHPSLLPRWRGASPLVFQILFNDRIVGVSLMKIVPKQLSIFLISKVKIRYTCLV